MPQSTTNVTPSEPSPSQSFSKLRIIKNLVVVSVATLLVMGTDDIVVQFQSSINQEKSMGVLSVALMCASVAVSSFLLPKYMVLKYGCKTIMALSILLVVPFLVANYYPVFSLMALSSAVSGVGFSLLWGSIDPYINSISRLYFDLRMKETLVEKIDPSVKRTKSIESQTYCESTDNTFYFSGTCYYIGNEYGHETKPISKYNLSNSIFENTKHANNDRKMNHFMATSPKIKKFHAKKESENHLSESITVRFFGFHSLIYQSCFILSSVIAFVVLNNGNSQNYPSRSNETIICGSAYCNIYSVSSQQNIRKSSTEAWNTLISVCIGGCLLAAVLVILFVDGLERKNENVTFSMDILMATFRHMKKKNQLLLTLLNINIGMMRGSYLADFTKSYISCSWGIQYVGLVTICAGATMVTFSSLSGWFVRHLGRLPIFLLAAISNTALNVILLLWEPNPDYPAMYFIAAGLWGGCFGTLHMQVRAFYGVLFKVDEEAAFGAYQFWYCVGISLCSTYSNLICNDIKIYLMIIIFTLGMIGYLIVERSHSLEHKQTSLEKDGSNLESDKTCEKSERPAQVCEK